MSKSHTPGFLKLVDECRARIKEYTVDEVWKKFQAGEKFHFIDVREESEWAQGFAKGATYMGKGVIERDIETDIADKNAEIVLYCGGGFRSALAGDNLKRMGYTNVASMDGGIRGWREAGLPVEKP
jgi:rhodanese-related sulfurtransferase